MTQYIYDRRYLELLLLFKENKKKTLAVNIQGVPDVGQIFMEVVGEVKN